jgi:predicted porin
MLQKSNTPPQLTCSATLAVDNAHQDSLTYWEFSLGRGLLPSTKLKNFKEFYMQKKIIALAVVAAAFSAPAFADPTVYGLLDGAVASISNTGQKSDMQALSGGLSTSRLGVKGAEDLGSGMKAVYQVEIKLDTQTAGGLAGAGRQTLLGVAGDFGTVATGYLQTAGYDFENKFDPAAGSSVSTVQNLTNAKIAGVVQNTFLIGTSAGASRAQRALAYISPNMSGLVVAVNYSTALAGLGNLTNAAATDNKTTAMLLSAMYEAGPLAVGGVYASTSNGPQVAGGSNSDMKEYALGASYDLGMAKISSTYQNSKTNAATSPANNANKLFSLSGVIPAGPGAVVLSYAKATMAVGTNVDGTSYTGAYLYSLSKTVTAYGAYSHVSNGSAGNIFSVASGAVAGGASTAGATSSIVAVGLKKVF